MRRRTRQAALPGSDRRGRRQRWALALAVATLLGLGGVFAFGEAPRFLMPGPLTSPHAAIESCSACHTSSGSGTWTWVRGLVAGDPGADSKACLTCHGMSDTALNAHSAPEATLSASKARLTARTVAHPSPFLSRAQDTVFPVGRTVDRGLFCATCHQEHRGAAFKLAKVSTEQCSTCHGVKVGSFDGDHPDFDGYPFRRRSRIIYDHAGHFGKHFPELASKGLSARIPETCSTCHDSTADRRVMSVTPFERACASCHQDQILGFERVSGPKGLAVLTLPGLDLQTLKKRKAVIGEWPEASEATLTPFMKVMIGRNARGRALLETVGKLDLQDLSRANDGQVAAVVEVAWEIKQMVYRLMTGKASDLLADFGDDGGAKPDPRLIGDLTAGLPRDVIVSAQRQWLPNLASEISARTSSATTRTSIVSGPPSPPVPVASAAPAEAKAAVASGRKSELASPDVAEKSAPAQSKARTGTQKDDLLVLTDDERRALTAVAKSRSGPAVTPTGNAASPSAPPPRAEAKPEAQAPSASAASRTVVAVKPAEASLTASDMEADVDAESWADVGGWYRQDHTIFYRPVGHKDKFMTAWLTLTGPAARKGASRPAAAVFDALTEKDAQGSCAKCHSVDALEGQGRRINFSPLGIETKKKGRLTTFVHEPHVALAPRGCVTCHAIEKGKPYLESYKDGGDPSKAVSNFAAMKKEVCATCHKPSGANQDCQTCHKYHVDGAESPLPQTRLTVD